MSVVGGLAYRATSFEQRLENSLFTKGYFYRARANQTAPNGVKLERDASFNSLALGDVLRFTLTDFAKREAERHGITLPPSGMFYEEEARYYGIGFYQPGNEHADYALLNPWIYIDAHDDTWWAKTFRFRAAQEMSSCKPSFPFIPGVFCVFGGACWLVC